VVLGAEIEQHTKGVNHQSKRRKDHTRLISYSDLEDPRLVCAAEEWMLRFVAPIRKSRVISQVTIDKPMTKVTENKRRK
jgi:hypothetical protein